MGIRKITWRAYDSTSARALNPIGATAQRRGEEERFISRSDAATRRRREIYLAQRRSDAEKKREIYLAQRRSDAEKKKKRDLFRATAQRRGGENYWEMLTWKPREKGRGILPVFRLKMMFISDMKKP